MSPFATGGIKRHRFGTKKANMGFWFANFSQLAIFGCFNLLSALAATIHKDKAMLPIACLYIFFVIASFFAPIFLILVRGRSIILTFLTSLCYLVFAGMNIIGTQASLFVGAIICGLGSPIWVSTSVTTSKLSGYIAERELLREIQDGQWLNPSPEDQPDHPINQITNTADPEQQAIQRDWYLSTILDKNNRIIQTNLSFSQTQELQTRAAAKLGSFSTISWLFMQASSILGALIAFGLLNVHIGDYSGLFESETPVVRLMYGIFTTMTLLGCVGYVISVKVIPPRVYFNPNQLSKLELHLQATREKQNPQDNFQTEQESDLSDGALDDEQISEAEAPASPSQISPRDDDDGSISDFDPLPQIQTKSQTPPLDNDKVIHWDNPIFDSFILGRAQNDSTDDYGNIVRPSILGMLKQSSSATWRLATDKAILILLLVFFVAYTPLSFTLSAFTSKGGLKDVIGVVYIPLFIGLVALADVSASFVLRFFLKSMTIARIAGVAGLSLQFLAVILMYAFPSSDWNGRGDAWKFAAIIGVIMGFGDALSISAISTLIAIMCRVDPQNRLLSSAFALSMIGRGLGLCSVFIINWQTTNDSFRSLFLPIMFSLMGVSMLCQLVSWASGWKIDVNRVFPVSETQAEEEKSTDTENQSEHIKVEMPTIKEEESDSRTTQIISSAV